jgi:hypothetical protein
MKISKNKDKAFAEMLAALEFTDLIINMADGGLLVVPGCRLHKRIKAAILKAKKCTH